MSIRWIRNVLIEDEETTVEIQIGYRVIGDKCYTRVGNDIEVYFNLRSENRDEIVFEGKKRLQKQLSGKKITYPDGRIYDWD